MAPVCGFVGGTQARQRLVALSLVSVVIALVPLADICPPDPTWLAGLYDDGDFDEVVELVASARGVVSKIVIGCTSAADVIARAVWPESHLDLDAGSSPFTVRAPPFSARIAAA